MRVLLDTHVALWCLADHRRLTRRARAAILAAGDEVHFSVASLWEIAVKSAIRKLEADAGEIRAKLLDGGYRELSILGEHAVHVSRLPLYHRDPFDRLLLAQAMVAGLRFLTADDTLAAYGDAVVVV